MDIFVHFTALQNQFYVGEAVFEMDLNRLMYEKCGMVSSVHIL